MRLGNDSPWRMTLFSAVMMSAAGCTSIGTVTTALAKVVVSVGVKVNESVCADLADRMAPDAGV